ncbi:DsrE family protein [Humibacter ginsenosidimutans]|uniref:Uncharacterized protein n=1 Tax=Humibacter ginsenosidimutans TaxID=2599293 RepID=A0A5B8M057_9MICO|nr:hypothetical protein [Humibacter ginsenosidimutans]QDZ14178.1 hypothetical protein FPZ11_04770 [Humibacter ginsenosidimutans]
MMQDTPHGSVILLHVSDSPEDVARAVAASSSLTGSRPGLRVRIIVNGAALEGVTETAESVTTQENTTVEACQVGMRRREISPDQLQPEVQTVESALTTLVDAQLAGAVYIRI